LTTAQSFSSSVNNSSTASRPPLSPTPPARGSHAQSFPFHAESTRHRSSAAGVYLLCCCFPVAQSISNLLSWGEQTIPRHPFLLTRAVALAATRRPTVVRPHERNAPVVARFTSTCS
jgi:hypothetical protein